MTSNRPLVSVVLLSYDRPAYLAESLASLVRQTYANLEITVVDNPSASSDEIARIVRRHTNVELIRNQTNLGYAGGMNAGIEAARGRYVFLTEDDIVSDADCITRLVEYMNDHPRAGLVAPMIYNKTSGTIRCAGGEFELGAIYRKKIYGAGDADTGQFPRPFEVGCVDGATMFACTDFLKHLRGFRAEFFMYVEAVELCARVVKTGRMLAVVPRAKVYHFEPPEKNAPPEIEFHKLKNFYALYLLHAPARVLPLFLLRYALWNTLRTAATKRTAARPALKALLWAMRRAPALLRERRRDFSTQFDAEENMEADRRARLDVVKHGA